jgi:hypothetical protein
MLDRARNLAPILVHGPQVAAFDIRTCVRFSNTVAPRSRACKVDMRACGPRRDRQNLAQQRSGFARRNADRETEVMDHRTADCLRLSKTCRGETDDRARARVARNRRRRQWRLEDGWGAWIRTREWRNQNPLPYHLATPHRDAPGQARSDGSYYRIGAEVATRAAYSGHARLHAAESAAGL